MAPYAELDGCLFNLQEPQWQTLEKQKLYNIPVMKENVTRAWQEDKHTTIFFYYV